MNSILVPGLESPNRRASNFLNKIYRHHQTDIWGALADVSHDKLITSFIADANKAQLIAELRTYPIKISIKIKREVLWGNKRATKKVFLYQLTQAPKRIKPIKRTLGATNLKDRKKTSLFYFGGRIREKTLRKFSKLLLERSYSSPHNEVGKNKYLTYVSYKTFTIFLEARLDVLVLRIETLPTMLCIRQALYHRKGIVKGQTPLNHPGFLVKMGRNFTMDKDYLKEFQKTQKEKEKKMQKRKKAHPKYLTISHALIGFFKLFEPLFYLIRYPFKGRGPKVQKYNRIKR